MGSLIEVQGNLFDADVDAIGHGCNVCATMGGGIARLFSNRFPTMYEHYKRLCKEGLFTPGEVYIYPLMGEEQAIYKFRYVLNMATQQNPGPDAKLEHITACFDTLKRRGETSFRLGLPKIAAGIGGLEWDDVRSCIEASIEDTNIDVTVYCL